jgi:hypothetical protein
MAIVAAAAAVEPPGGRRDVVLPAECDHLGRDVGGVGGLPARHIDHPEIVDGHHRCFVASFGRVDADGFCYTRLAHE